MSEKVNRITEIGILRSILCNNVMGHRYYTVKAFSTETRCVGCKRCHNVWAMNDRVKSLVKWDTDFSDFYNFK